MRTTELHVGTCAADTGIDELAVTQVAADGMRMHLQGAERDEAIRRMHGRVDTELIAWRASTPPAEPCNESWPATGYDSLIQDRCDGLIQDHLLSDRCVVTV